MHNHALAVRFGARLVRVTIILAASVASIAIATAVAPDMSRALRAISARLISVNDRAELHLLSAVGNTLVEEGRASGTFSGSARVRLTLDVETRTATSRFTLRLHGGSLTGQGRGKAHTGTGGWESFGGTMWFEGGTGRYAHASGSGNLYGAINRDSDRLQVQMIGRMRV
jgi:hypothetical protein